MAAAVPLWMHLSLLEECRGRVERALTTLVAGVAPDARREMKLQAALGASLMYIRGAYVPEIGAIWTRALELAESLDDTEYQLRALWGLWVLHTAGGRHRAALTLAQTLHGLAARRPDQNDRLIGDRLIGISQHYLGDQKSARRHIERMLAGYVAPDHRSDIIRFQLDPRVAARVFLARILWLQGFPDQATRAAHRSVEDARATNHANSLGYALARAACPIALLDGDLAAAEHYVGMLLDHSTRYGLALWLTCSRFYQGAIAIERGHVTGGLRLLRIGFDEFGETWFTALQLIGFLMAEALGRAGQIADGLAAIEEAIARSERSEQRWGNCRVAARQRRAAPVARRIHSRGDD